MITLPMKACIIFNHTACALQPDYVPVHLHKVVAGEHITHNNGRNYVFLRKEM